MLDMFWIALELSNPMVGLITRLSLQLKHLIAFKFGEVAKSGNAGLACETKSIKWTVEDNAGRKDLIDHYRKNVNTIRMKEAKIKAGKFHLPFLAIY